MATSSLFKVIGQANAGVEFVNTDGAVTMLLDGTRLLKEQEAAIVSLTDSSGGTANDTLQAISGTYVQAEVANNFADLAAKVNAILVALRNHGLIAT